MTTQLGATPCACPYHHPSGQGPRRRLRTLPPMRRRPSLPWAFLEERPRHDAKLEAGRPTPAHSHATTNRLRLRCAGLDRECSGRSRPTQRAWSYGLQRASTGAPTISNTERLKFKVARGLYDTRRDLSNAKGLGGRVGCRRVRCLISSACAAAAP